MSHNFPPLNDPNNGNSYQPLPWGNGQNTPGYPLPEGNTPYYPPPYIQPGNNTSVGHSGPGVYAPASQIGPGAQMQGNFYHEQTIAGQFQGPPPPKPASKGPLQWYKRQSRGKKLGIGCGSLFLILLLCTCSTAALASRAPTPNTSTSPASTPVVLAQSGPTKTIQKGPVATATKKVEPTATAKTVPANSSTPVEQPTHPIVPTPTSVPSADPTSTPVPLVVPTPTPIPPVVPTPTPAPPAGVNGNPWGYDFNPGNFITQPPATFCNYFSCIPNFYNGHGYVVECQDSMYSLSGGVRGACSYHGGILQPLYSH